MNGLDEVPFKIPLGTLEGPLDKLDLVSAPDLIIPDHEKILQETKYEFRLENWVLTLIQGPSAHPPSLSSKPQPSCPPYWLMFGGPQESRLADLLEVVPRQRSHSLTAIEGLCVHHRIKWLISDSEGEDGYSEDDESSSTEEDGELPWPRGRVAQQHKQRKQRECRRGSSQQLLHQQSPCSSTRHRRALSLSLRGGSPRVTCQQHPKRKLQSLGHVSRRHSLTPQPPCSSLPRSQPPPRPSTAEHIPSMRNDKATVKSLSRYSRLPPPPSVARSRNFHATFPDSSAELLSALSQDERDLLETITEQGYPLHAAVVALQKTGRQSLEKVLSYLLAYDHLCKLGYDETQVEEALEMFQNSEAKAAEFLHLLTQFKEMGFQQNVIKEALLVHENHQERALEELMTRAA